MTSGQMTAISAVGAGVAFVTANLPDGTPELYEVLLGALNAGLLVYLGVTNKGTAGSRKRQAAALRPPKPAGPLPPGVP